MLALPSSKENLTLVTRFSQSPMNQAEKERKKISNEEEKEKK
jgi:hypothetical protein